jgi:phage/plasmid-like protein (TIGR03299 family)
MAHEVETMMYAGQTPWHGLGVYVGDENLLSEQAIEMAGLDWKVAKAPIFANMVEPVDTHVAMRRNTDGRILGVVGANYQPLQNAEAFSFLDSLVEDGDMTYHTAGSLRDGQRVWMLGQIGSNEVVPGDRVDDFILLHNSHDGSSSLRVLWTSVRVVCANTARMALSEGAGEGVKIRHTKNMTKRVDESRKVLGIAKTAAQVQYEANLALAKKNISTQAWKDFLADLIPDRDEGRNTRRENVRDDLTRLFESGIGTDIPGVRGTAWGALNAVTEYTSHHSTVKTTKPGLRFENVMFGAGAKMNKRAAELLVAA